MNRLAVINVVGLTRSLLGPHTPHISGFAKSGVCRPLRQAFPAVTCTAQSDYLTGTSPTEHGIVGNGWYDRDLAEVHFWKQSNHLVQRPKIWEEMRSRHAGFTCAKLFWWFNMYSGADYTITPRPMYPADGRKVFDIYTHPSSIQTEIQGDLGRFPFPTFWGPAAGRCTPQGSADAVSRWIARAAKWVEERHSPTLNLIYLPHLDYNLQRLGPGDASVSEDLRQIDRIVGELLTFFNERDVECLLLSEYGIAPVNQPVHLNRRFREEGWLKVREELGLELLDPGASDVFAVADHQVAHVYVKDTALIGSVKRVLESVPGVERVLGREEKTKCGIQHRRAGDLIAVARSDAWFTYYYWLDDRRAPDFARTIDIHRKPGYDPVELFLDPAIPAVKLKILWRLLQKAMGFRMLMDVIPLQANLVKGSHGRMPESQEDWPVVIGQREEVFPESELCSTDIYRVIRRMM